MDYYHDYSCFTGWRWAGWSRSLDFLDSLVAHTTYWLLRDCGEIAEILSEHSNGCCEFGQLVRDANKVSYIPVQVRGEKKCETERWGSW